MTQTMLKVLIVVKLSDSIKQIDHKRVENRSFNDLAIRSSFEAKDVYLV